MKLMQIKMKFSGQLLDITKQFWKATMISLSTCVSQCVFVQQHDSQRMDFCEISCLGAFKFFDKF